MTQIDTLYFWAKGRKKTIRFEAGQIYIADVKWYPPPLGQIQEKYHI